MQIKTNIIDSFLNVSLPTENYGITPFRELQYISPTQINIGIIKADLSALKGTVISARFGIHISGVFDGPATLEWYEILRDWEVGTKNGESEIGAVCGQSSKLGSTDWTVVGARGDGTDRNPIPDGSALFPLVETEDYSIPVSTPLVQKWIDNPLTNNGLLLIPKEIPGLSVAIMHASETTTGKTPFFLMDFIPDKIEKKLSIKQITLNRKLKLTT